MHKINQICSTCCGIGSTITWKLASEDIEAGFGTMQKEETICETCNGKGYLEYAIFSIEEAEAILKHCGLSTES